MAKAIKKDKPVLEENEPIKEAPVTDNVVPEEPLKQEYPIIKEEIIEPVKEKILKELAKDENVESDEILFLRRIMDIQEYGGWGRHLHSLINERISELKNK